MKIIIDTNFLLIPTQFKVDIFTEIQRIVDFKHELYIIDKTIDELEKIIKEQKNKDKVAAKIALEMLKNKEIKVIKTDNDNIVDDNIVEIAKKEKITVATQDKELRVRLKRQKARLITLKQKKYLMIED